MVAQTGVASSVTLQNNGSVMVLLLRADLMVWTGTQIIPKTTTALLAPPYTYSLGPWILLPDA